MCAHEADGKKLYCMKKSHDNHEKNPVIIH